MPEPGARRRLGLGTGIYNIGTGMFMTSSVLYFTEGLGLSVTEVGLWLAVAGLIGLFAGVPMGHLADRRGPRGVAALSLVVLAATMVGYVFVTSIWMFVAVTVVEMLATAASRASRGGLIRRVGGEGAAAYRSQLRAIENAGVGVGAVSRRVGTDAAHPGRISGAVPRERRDLPDRRMGVREAPALRADACSARYAARGGPAG